VSLRDLQEEEFQIKATHQGGVLKLDFLGSIQQLNPEDFMVPYLTEVFEYAREKKLKIECHFVGLEYMNSASIPPLITLMRNMAEKKVHGVFIYDASRKVQAASFKALDVIARKSEFTTVQGV